MADITKCKGTNCPVKEKCYRFTAKSDEILQSYFLKPPIKYGKCEKFWGENSQQIYEQLKEIVKQ